MHLLARLSLKNKALIALVTIVASLFGVLSMTGLKQELMPSVQFPAVAVITSYPGASPEVVNNDVSLPIEEAVRGVPALEQSSSTSSTGASMVLLEFTYGTDITVTEQRVERAISRITQLLPDVDPQVVSGSIDDFPVIQIAVGAPGDTSSDELAELLELQAVPKIEEIDGVRQVQIGGAAGRRVTVTPDVEALAERGFTEQAIRDAMQQNGVLLPGGQVTDDDYTLSVQVGGRVESVEDLAAIPLIPGVPTLTTISDVATVTEEPNPVSTISRIDGEPAVTIAITKLSSANTVEVSHAVQELLPELEAALAGASLTVVFDQAPYIEQSVETLAVEGLLGLVFAVIIILVFLLSLRATLVTAVSIPTSLLLTFIGLNFADYTLNLLTLGALTISIGRVVDDSIVVIENIKRHLIEGADRTKSIILAVREVATAITASTVTTIAVFLPLAFVEGLVGELFAPFAFTASYALAASLLVSLTIVPVLAYWFLKPAPAPTVDAEEAETTRSKSRRFLADDSPVTKLQRSYLPVIDWTLKRPIVTLLAALVVFGGTIAAYPLMKTNFIGADEQNAVQLTQTVSPGFSLEAQLTEVERVEEALSTVEGVETVQVTFGGADPAAAIFGGGGDGTISYSLTTDADAAQVEVQDAIRASLDELENAGEFVLSASQGGGFGGSSTVDINVTAAGQDSLRAGVDAVLERFAGHEAFSQIESNLGESRPTLAITIDREEAARNGMSEVMLASQVSGLMQPSSIGEIVLDDASVRVYLARDDAPETLDDVRALEIPTGAGTERLDALASVEVIDGPITITTENGVRSATVSATPAGDDLTVANAAVTELLDGMELPGGVTASIGGVLAEQEEAFGQLAIALLAAILIVYVVMVATFKSLLQPILLLVSVPFAATGAIILLIVTGVPLGVASLIGVLMLIGIVVTNAIVLVDLVNQLRARGMALKDAVRTGSAHRYRPILMTALATIFALIPMGLGITGKGGFISQPLALVVIGGLVSSTVLTLVVLPTLYYAVERRREVAHERRMVRRGA